MKKLFVVLMCIFITPILFIESIKERKNPFKSIKELKDNLSSIVSDNN